MGRHLANFAQVVLDQTGDQWLMGYQDKVAGGFVSRLKEAREVPIDGPGVTARAQPIHHLNGGMTESGGDDIGGLGGAFPWAVTNRIRVGNTPVVANIMKPGTAKTDIVDTLVRQLPQPVAASPARLAMPPYSNNHF
jgi:hypothetical protein